MTSRFTPLTAAISAALATGTVFSALLWYQQGGGSRPVVPLVQAAPIRSGGTRADQTVHDGSSAHRVPVDGEGLRLAELGVSTEPVRREALAEEIRAVATVVPDESTISHVHTRVSGWVEALDVNTTGQTVRAGQPLLRIFSPELLSSQIEYLAARQHAASGIATAVVAGGRARLGALGMGAAEIEAIERSGEPMRLVTVYAPHGGVVVSRGVTVGMSVDPSTTLVTVADLSRVWVLAEVPEASMSAVRAGSAARLAFPSSGRPPFTARADFVYPMLTERTRTLRVRVPVGNLHGSLKPGVYGTATFLPAGKSVLTVPRDAVVDTGLQQHVFVATGTSFEPRRVSVGRSLAGRIEIRAGLREGEPVVAAGVFLLDSESRLRAAGGSGAHQHGASPAGSTPDAPSGPSPAGGRHAQSRAGHDTHDSGDARPPAPAGDPHAGHAVPAAGNPHADQGVPGPDPHAGHRE